MFKFVWTERYKLSHTNPDEERRIFMRFSDLTPEHLKEAADYGIDWESYAQLHRDIGTQRGQGKNNHPIIMDTLRKFHDSAKELSGLDLKDILKPQGPLLKRITSNNGLSVRDVTDSVGAYINDQRARASGEGKVAPTEKESEEVLREQPFQYSIYSRLRKPFETLGPVINGQRTERITSRGFSHKQAKDLSEPEDLNHGRRTTIQYSLRELPDHLATKDSVFNDAYEGLKSLEKRGLNGEHERLSSLMSIPSKGLSTEQKLQSVSEAGLSHKDYSDNVRFIAGANNHFNGLEMKNVWFLQRGEYAGLPHTRLALPREVEQMRTASQTQNHENLISWMKSRKAAGLSSRLTDWLDENKEPGENPDRMGWGEAERKSQEVMSRFNAKPDTFNWRSRRRFWRGSDLIDPESRSTTEENISRTEASLKEDKKQKFVNRLKGHTDLDLKDLESEYYLRGLSDDLEGAKKRYAYAVLTNSRNGSHSGFRPDEAKQLVDKFSKTIDETTNLDQHTSDWSEVIFPGLKRIPKSYKPGDKVPRTSFGLMGVKEFNDILDNNIHPAEYKQARLAGVHWRTLAGETSAATSGFKEGGTLEGTAPNTHQKVISIVKRGIDLPSWTRAKNSHFSDDAIERMHHAGVDLWHAASAHESLASEQEIIDAHQRLAGRPDKHLGQYAWERAQGKSHTDALKSLLS